MKLKAFLRSVLLAAVATGLFACSDGGDGNTTDVITNSNNPPVAGVVSVTTNEDVSVQVVLQATDADGDTQTYAIVTKPVSGTLSELEGNVVTYTPNADFSGSDSFAYQASDQFAASNPATVTININQRPAEQLDIALMHRATNSLQASAGITNTTSTHEVYYSTDPALTIDNYLDLSATNKLVVTGDPINIDSLSSDTLYSIVVRSLAPNGGVLAIGATTINTLLDSAQAKLNLEDVVLPEGQTFSVTTSRSTSPIDNDGGVVEINTSNTETEIVGITNEYGTPYLLGRKLTGESEVEISLDSTAEIFVLMRPRFFDLEVSDYPILSTKIRSHEKFEQLKASLQESFKMSPCPLDSGCSPFAAYIANKISKDIDLSDVVSTEEQ